MIVVLLTEWSLGDKISPPHYTYYAPRHILYVSHSKFNSDVVDRVSVIGIQMKQH